MDNKSGEYTEFQMKIMQRFCANAGISVAAVILLYLFLWKRRGGDLIVWFLEYFMGIKDIETVLEDIRTEAEEAGIEKVLSELNSRLNSDG